MKDPLKPRDKITQKMSRDGLIEVNETKETAECISRREQETDFSKPSEQAAQDTAAQLTSPGTFPKTIPGKQSVSWSISAQRISGKRPKRSTTGAGGSRRQCENVLVAIYRRRIIQPGA